LDLDVGGLTTAPGAFVALAGVTYLGPTLRMDHEVTTSICIRATTFSGLGHYPSKIAYLGHHPLTEEELREMRETADLAGKAAPGVWATGELGPPFYQGFYAVTCEVDGGRGMLLQPNSYFGVEPISRFVVTAQPSMVLRLLDDNVRLRGIPRPAELPDDPEQLKAIIRGLEKDVARLTRDPATVQGAYHDTRGYLDRPEAAALHGELAAARASAMSQGLRAAVETWQALGSARRERATGYLRDAEEVPLNVAAALLDAAGRASANPEAEAPSSPLAVSREPVAKL
jgi:hypothetical protein